MSASAKADPVAHDKGGGRASVAVEGRVHPRSIGWFGAASMAMGGSNQSLFLLTGLIATQGSAAVPLLAIGLLLSWAAAPG